MKMLNKIAIVTGAAGQIGEAVCRQLEAEGATVLRMDGYIDSPEPCQALLDEAEGKFGRVDVLINCTPEQETLLPVGELDDETYQRTVLACQTGVFYMCRAAFRLFREQGFGVCVNVGTIQGAGAAGSADFELAQHGLVGLSRNIALQYAGDPAIRCNVVCAGPLAPAARPDPEYAAFVDRKGKAGYVPLVEADEVAKAVLFLACDDSARINGQFLQVDAGRYFKEA